MDKLKRYFFTQNPMDRPWIGDPEKYPAYCLLEDVAAKIAALESENAALEKRCAELEAKSAEDVRRYWKLEDYLKLLTQVYLELYKISCRDEDRADRLAVIADALAMELEARNEPTQ